MSAQNTISPELSAGGIARMLRSDRPAIENRAWHYTIQIALPLAGPTIGLIALIAISLVQG